jgi:hypothetical protein
VGRGAPATDHPVCFAPNLHRDVSLIPVAVHILPESGWGLQADHEHEVGPRAVRNVDPRGLSSKHHVPRACTGRPSGAQNSLETGKTALS